MQLLNIGVEGKPSQHKKGIKEKVNDDVLLLARDDYLKGNMALCFVDV